MRVFLEQQAGDRDDHGQEDRYGEEEQEKDSESAPMSQAIGGLLGQDVTRTMTRTCLAKLDSDAIGTLAVGSATGHMIVERVA